ncbi:SpaA isopeptide-forming pilin-related protein [Sporolactobacillus sp. CQH2019]|uniref:SpaA isopeptide-forming pilin-related protein n=1 Tax=Sporolactobacillus sp. CQH2019 TaxID=3023512 RepID=UPI002367E627|nr:SpaA isopeptide-forming pilin-related protein [Sporolactobacillus sp. CQH2019]MDD9148378.1 SpaA isopeptide-forming pilin-related protein [Sporolactobacillus sp. CQH2019]
MRAKRLPLGLKKTKRKKFTKQLLIIAVSLFVILSQTSMSPLGNALAETGNTTKTADNSQFFDMTKPVQLTTGTEPDQTKVVSQNNPIQKDNKVNIEYNYNLSQNLIQGLNKQPYVTTINIPKEFQFDTSVLKGAIKLADNATVIGSYSIDAQTHALTLTINKTTTALAGTKGKIALAATFHNDLQEGQNEIKFDLGSIANSPYAVPVWTVVQSSAAGNGSSSTASGSSGSAAASTTSGSASGSSNSSSVSSADQSSSTAVSASSSSSSAAPKINRFSAAASTSAQTGTQITQNILTGVTLTDANGKPYDQSNRATTDSPANIDFTYTIPNGLKVNDGDYYTFKLPSDFAIYNTIGPLPLTDGNGIQIGTFTVGTDGTVTMTFINNASNDFYFDSHSYVDGTLTVNTRFDTQTITGTTQQQITFPISQPVTLTIPFKPSKTMDSIDKQGSPDKSYNPTSINWTININQTENMLTNAKLTDPTLTGLTLDTNSVKVYPVTVNVDGSTTVGTTPIDSSQYTLNTADGNLEIDFNKPISSAYQIQYSTAITDAGKDIKNFDNKATLSSDENSPLTADASVDNNRGTHLTKSATGYDASTQTITWTINYNGDEKNIADGTVLHDLFDNTQSLDGSVQVYHATVNDNGSFSQGALVDSGSGAYTVTPASTSEKNGFDLTFNGTGNSGAYQIVYKTKANGLVTANGTVNNSVQENSGTPVPASKGTAEQGIIKYSTSANYANKTDTWHITVNGNGYLLKNATITDTFDNAGLSLQNSTFKIHDVTTNTDLTEGTDYTLTSDSNGFTVIFKSAYSSTSDAFTIDYTTDFNYANLTSGKVFSNTSKLDWTDENGDPQHSSSTATFTPDSDTKSNGFKNGSYNAVSKQITWNIGVNYNLATITDPVISDPITGDQQYVDGSLEVHYMTLTGGANGITVGDNVPAGDYSVDYPSSANSNTLTVHFNHSITTPYYITFKTSLAGQVVNQTYANTATVKDGNTQVTALPASVSPSNGGSFASKSGAQDGNYVDWTVNINASQSTISNAQLDDTPTNNQIIDPNSFHLYPQTVDASGNLTTDTSHELQQGKDYTLAVNTDNNTGAQTFTIKFAKTIDSAYQLTYRTMINANDRDTLGNTATLSGSNTQTVSQQTSQSVVVRVSSGSGTGSGVNGSLTVLKEDSLSKQPLAGATFTLYDSTGTTALRTLTTNSDGKAAFNNFKYGDYILKETQAPNGYTISDALVSGTKITIDASSSAAGAVTAVDDSQNKVILTKQDVNGQPLAGATFQLESNIGGNWTPTRTDQTIQSDANGKVEIDGLAPGSYQLTETSAPAGYLVNSTPINFTVTTNANNQIPDVNAGVLTDYQGSAVLTKDDNANHPLAGAVYKLQMQNGDGSWNTIKQNLVTGSDGKISASGLAPGTYRFAETEAPNGYTVNASPVEFTIASSGSGDPGTQQLTQSDTQSSVVLTKVDANDGNAKLAGAEFALQDSQGHAITKDAFGKDLPAAWTTDSSGQFTVTGLSTGSYQFVETKAPNGYQLDTAPIPFNVTNGDTKAQAVTSADNLDSATLTKVDANDGNAKLAGAEFTLQDSQGHAVTKDAFGKELSATWTTDSNGQFTVSGLPAGDYQFVETKAPSGYQLDATPIPFTVTNTEVKAVPILATDKLNQITLTKVDKNDNSIHLQGAEFKLEDSSGNIVTKDVKGNDLQPAWTTDQNGQFTITGLPTGSYQFVETKAPNGYQLDTTPIPFTVTNTEAKAVPITATDELDAATLTKADANDGNAKLAGAEFALQDSQGHAVAKDASGKDLPAAWTTDSSGRFTVSGLAAGDYQFVETKAPSGYQLDTTPIPFTVTNTEVKAVPITATDKLNQITLTKVDANDSNIHLQGAEFQLYGSDNQLITKDINGNALPAAWTTDSNGQFTISGLPAGSYHFVETKAPNGYQLDATPIPFTVTNTEIKAVPITATDKLDAATLTKVDANDSNAKLAGAEFKLENSSGQAVTKDINGNTLKSIWTTDSSGQFTVSGLPAGSYQFVETKAPNGYQLDTTPIPFKVTNTEVKAVPITATDKLDAATLTKVDANDSNAKLAGAEFKLEDSSGQAVTKDINGNTLKSIWTTDSSGQFTVSGLPAGSYQFVETKAPSGYQLDATPIPFKVTNTDVAAVPITATDRLTPGDVRLTKVDRNDSSIHLQGAVFKLEDSHGKTLKTGLITDANGQFTVKGLAPGHYFFVETAAPKNYRLDSTPIPFAIAKGQAKAVEITATDRPDLINQVIPGGKPGGTYNVVDQHGHIVAHGVSADKTGNVSFKGLAGGKYHLVQTAASGKSGALPITGDTSDIAAVAGGSLLLISGGAIAFFTRRRKNRD